MPYWRLFYHIIWATKGRHPFLGDLEEPIAMRSIKSTLDSYRAITHAIGAMPDHIHVAASIPPSAALSDVIGRMKGASAHAINHVSSRTAEFTFAWQAEYGVHSFGERALEEVVDYITNQKARHASKQLWPALERADDK